MPANKIEVLKAAKDGLDVLPDLFRYASLAAAGEDPQIPPDDLEQVDARLLHGPPADSGRRVELGAGGRHW